MACGDGVRYTEYDGARTQSHIRPAQPHLHPILSLSAKYHRMGSAG